MKIIEVPFSMGSLGKNLGCEKAAKVLGDKFPKVEKKIVAAQQDNIVETNEAIEEAVKGEEKALILGGDHSITYSSYKAFSFAHPDAGIIIFDAHADCQSGISPPSHEDYLRTLVEEGHVDPSRVILIGVRTMTKEEQEFIEEQSIKIYNPEEIKTKTFEKVKEEVLEKAKGWEAIYLSIDIDAIDPAFAPGTGYPESDGLLPEQVLSFIKSIKKLEQLKIRDLVEINPDKDIEGKTVELGKNIVEALL